MFTKRMVYHYVVMGKASSGIRACHVVSPDASRDHTGVFYEALGLPL